MDSTACSISFSYNNSVIDHYSRSGVQKIGKFQQTRTISFHDAVVINGNNNRSSRGHELIRCFRNCCRLDLRSSNIAPKVQATMSSSKSNICKKKEGDESVRTLSNLMKEWSQLRLVKVAGLVGGMFLVIPSAGAFDTMKTFSCLLNECRLEFAKCMANPSCAANVTCIETCHNRPDESDCQIRCGDLFQNSVVDEFNMCVISRKKCVPKKSDVAEFPAPDPAALVKSFSIADFSGKWFISSGLNPTFDTFDCQLHDFHTEGNKLVANLSWRIQTPDGGFFTRSAVQRFAQDPKQPAILHNHDNDYLHYQDDWYILSSKIENKPDDYIFIYYRGKNDAWNGYGGAIIYTRSAVLPETILPELEKAAKSIGRDFNKFIRTDNSCGPEPTFVERLEKKVNESKKMIIREAKEIKGQVERVGKTEKTLFQRLCEGFKELQQDLENVLRGLSKEETDLLSQLNMEAKQAEDLFGRTLSIRKLR